MAETKTKSKRKVKKTASKKGDVTYIGDRARVSSQGIIFTAGETISIPLDQPRRKWVIKIFQDDSRFEVK